MSKKVMKAVLLSRHQNKSKGETAMGVLAEQREIVRT